jgi:hypothetical protein
MKKNTWYNHFKKASNEWYNFSPVITLYHGTNDDVLRRIFNDKMILPPSPEKIVDRVLNNFELTRTEVPEYVWGSQVKMREGMPYIFCSINKQTAVNYARSMEYGGEIETMTTKAILEWADENRISLAHPKKNVPVVLTIDLPWEKVKFWHGVEHLKNIVEKVQEDIDSNEHVSPSAKNTMLQNELEEINLEVMISEPIPIEFISKIETF